MLLDMQDSGQGRNFEFEGNFKDGPISQECCRHFDKKVRFHLLN